jgi:hypothetical protein
MDKTLDYCWSKALEFTKRAEETTDDEVREFFYRLRDAWIRAANHQEVFAGPEGILPAFPASDVRVRAH